MLEHEIQKLTAVIAELTAIMREHAKPNTTAPAAEPTSLSSNKPATQKPVETKAKEPEPETHAPGVTREGLKEISRQIVRADTSKKKEIVDILEAHGAPTITKLADAQIHAVYGKFLALAHQVAKDAEAAQ